MSRECELAHRRLFDLLCILGKPICGDDSTIREASRVKESDWMRVRGELERKGWHRSGDGGLTHDGTAATVADSLASHQARSKQTAQARLAKTGTSVHTLSAHNKPEYQTSPVTSLVTGVVTGVVTDVVTQRKQMAASGGVGLTSPETTHVTSSVTTPVTENSSVTDVVTTPVTAGEEEEEIEEEVQVHTHTHARRLVAEGGGAECEVEPPKGFPKTAEEAKASAMAGGYPSDFAVKTWEKAMSRGGRDSRDVPIRRWASYLATEWRYEQERLAKTPTTALSGGDATRKANAERAAKIKAQIERM